MVEQETVWWTLSSLLQGLCAVYGLFIVYYVYQRSQLHEEKRRILEKPDPMYLFAGTGGKDYVDREWVRRRAERLNMEAELGRRVRLAVWQLLWFSIPFVIAISFDVLGLIWDGVMWYFWMGVILSTFALGLIGSSFVLVGIVALRDQYRTKRSFEKEGDRFYKDSLRGEVWGYGFPLDAVSQAHRDQWEERKTLGRVGWLVLVIVILSIIVTTIITYFFS